MIKIYSILLLILVLCGINASIEYINFIPYENSCSSSSTLYGVGYSIQLNTCFAISNSDNGWLFTYNNETESIQGTEYLNQVNQPLCDSSRKVNSIINMNNGDCINKDLNFSPKTSPTSTPFYQVSISKNQPSLPIEMVQAFSHMLGGCNVTENQLIGMEYLTNSSQIYNQVNNNWEVDIYICTTTGVPIVINPIYEVKGETCTKSYPFLPSNNSPIYTYIYQHCI